MALRRSLNILLCCVLLCAIANGPAFAGGKDTESKPLGTTLTLRFSFGGDEVIVSTATTGFALEGHVTDSELRQKVHANFERVVDLSGVVSPRRHRKGWLIRVKGTVTHQDMERRPADEIVLENALTEIYEFKNEASMFIDASVFLKPGEKKLIASHGGQEMWLTLEVDD